MRTAFRIPFVFAAVLPFAAVVPASAQPPGGATPRVVLSTFERLPPGSAFAEVLRAAGPPDADVGSGIHIYVYHLSDGSRVWVGTPDRRRLLYVRHITGSVGTQLYPPAK